MNLNNKNKAFFISHCDAPDCDLGYLSYYCPKCKKYNEDTDVWWEEDNIYRGSTSIIQCEHCNQKLVVKQERDSSNENLSNTVVEITN